VRGSPEIRGLLRQGYRSIPACAGEPRGARPGGRRGEVYPRVCGGAA